VPIAGPIGWPRGGPDRYHWHVTDVVRGLPHPADFQAPPGAADRVRWAEADREARPRRLARLRDKLAAEGFDAYFGVRSENSRYLTGFALEDGEDKVAGNSGRFLISGEDVVVLADSRYRLQAAAQAPEARVEPVTYDLAAGWPDLVRSVGARRIAVEAGFVSHELWQQLAAAAPEVELAPAAAWVEAQRAIKEPAEVDRIRSACAVADRALASIVRRIKPGRSERDMALSLEWEIRTGGAEALAFGVACLAGPNAALPHGSPGETEAMSGQVLLFDFGAMVDGYRSDMTRTFFVGSPSSRDTTVYEIVAHAQQTVLERLREGLRGQAPVPSGREADAAARAVIEEAGHGPHFGHGTGHGIGLATHESPSLSRSAGDTPLSGPTVFSVEPGIYLDGEMGVRIEDLVLFDPATADLEILTHFPREMIVVGV
jgi:Xaa-Pro aminopeptidase